MLELKEYIYMNDGIYWQGKLQPPREQKVYYLKINGDMAYFYDELGNSYSEPTSKLVKVGDIV
jgi:hypothetical protein